MAVKQRFPWVGVSAIVAVVIVGVVAGLRIPEFVETSPNATALPVLGLTQLGPDAPAELIAEQLAAYDPTPMFIPSAMNSSDPVLPTGARPGVDGPFDALAPELTKNGPLRFPAPVPIPVNPVAGLRLTERANAPLAINRVDVIGPGLTLRFGQLEAEAVDGSGRVALTLDLPAAADIPADDWSPLELMGAVTRTGLVGELVVTASSGSDEADDFFRSYLRKNMRIDARLGSGFYVFRVGP